MPCLAERDKEAQQLIRVDTGPLRGLAELLPGCLVVAQQEIHPAFSQQQRLPGMSGFKPVFCLLKDLQLLRKSALPSAQGTIQCLQSRS